MFRQSKSQEQGIAETAAACFPTLAAWMQGLSPVPLAACSIGIGIAEEQRDAPPEYDSLGVNKASCFQDAFHGETAKGSPSVKSQVCPFGGGRGMLRHSGCQTQLSWGG